MSHLFSHQRMHSGEKASVCTECGQGFSQKANLFRQNVSLKGEALCMQGLWLRLQPEVSPHKTSEDTFWEKPYVCKECEWGFSDKAALIIHQRTHSGEKSYVCNRCGESFMLKSHLIRHQRAHLLQRRFMYRECRQGFSNVIPHHSR